MSDVVLAETAAGVTTITLADEENRNALGAAVVTGLREPPTPTYALW